MLYNLFTLYQMNLTEADSQRAVKEAQRIINQANPYLKVTEHEMDEVLAPGRLIDVLKELKPSKSLVSVGLCGLALGLTWGLLTRHSGALVFQDFIRLGVSGISGTLITSTYHGIYSEFLRDSLNIG